MDSKQITTHGAKKGDEEMAVLAKPVNRVPVVKKENSTKFVREFNKNKVSKNFLESCQKAAGLFEKKK